MANQRAAPEWSLRIKRLILKLRLSQAGLAERIGVSPATITRWLQGSHEPTSAAYVAMGNLAGSPDGIYFWERAGLDPAIVADTNPRITLSSLQVSLKDFQVVAARKLSTKTVSDKPAAVVLPLLNITAYGNGASPQPHVTLAQAEIEDMLMAPLGWCPHPDSMISLRLAGDSMLPIIPPDSIVAVDTAVTERGQVDQKLTVFWHRDLGFKVARLQRLPASDILVSANHNFLPVDVSDPSKWKLIGEVLWWFSKDSHGVAGTDTSPNSERSHAPRGRRHRKGRSSRSVAGGD
jgi:transcriptional regulator with XRE-family HTH domain